MENLKKLIIEETIEEKSVREQKESITKIAKNISSLAKSVNALLNGELKERALLVLLASTSGQPHRVIKDVLEALKNMERDWLK
jgi:hypothetical protein